MPQKGACQRGGGWLIPMPKVYDLPTVRPTEKEIVPRWFHYVHLVKPGGRYDFNFIGLLSILSVLKFGKPKRIYVHFTGEIPTGRYWAFALKAIRRKRVQLVYKEYDYEDISIAPTGHRFRFMAGISDLIRIRALIEFGGVYLDQDIILLKDITELFHYPFVSGIEKTTWYFPWPIMGLLSAFLVSEKNASFAKRWYQEYATSFDKPNDYNLYAIRRPWKLAKDKRYNDIHVLPFTSTAFPLWADQQKVFDRNEYRFIRDAYVLHLWDSAFRNRLKPFIDDPLRIYMVDNLFTMVARSFLTQKQTMTLTI